MDKYYLVKLLINQQEQAAPSIDVYDTYDQVIVAYHNILAAYHNAPDVKFAVVEIQNGIGNTVIKEQVEHEANLEPEEQGS